MRIISGTLKGRLLKGPALENVITRPTSDRAREALFSILQKYPKGPFIDLFAGTGAIAVEAWSRGYSPITCIESSAATLSCIKINIKNTEIKLIAKDIRNLSNNAFINQAVVFSDPPYELSAKYWITMAPVIKNWLLPESSVLVWETDRFTDLQDIDGLKKIEARHYGNNKFHFFVT